MEAVLQVVQRINFYLSDYILVFLLIGTGLYFSVRTRFVQVRCFGEGMRAVFGEFNMRGGRQKGGLSSFQALTTAIAAQVGTGNIIGACGAILLGGPGAIFWMWIIAFFGMATIYAEAVLAQETRRVAEDGSVSGGPVYYIKRAFPGRFGTFLAGFFAVALILALGFMGCMVQSNSIGETCAAAFGVPSWAVGIAVAVLAAVVFLGGIQRIAGVTEKLVPVMAALYLLGGLVVLVCRVRYLPEAVGMIFRYAFVPNAIIGGSLGYALKMAVSQGVKRGLFSNEAGMGSTPHAHAMAKVKHPHEQGVVAMTGVFIDTFVVLTMTALVVISTLFAYVLGLPLGVALTVTQPHGIRPNKAVNQILGWIVNIGRSIPFIILMVAIMPFTKLVVGTKIGVRGAIVPLVVSAAPFIARMVETSLAEVDAGVVEAAQSMGASTFQIIWKVYLPEAKPSLVLGGAISIVTILGYTAIAGTVGAGGLGDIAVRYGHQRFITSVMWVTVVILIVMVQVVQSLFNWLSKKIDKRLDTGTKKSGTFDLLSRLAHTK